MANPPLAATLRRIGREGREAFYDGAGHARHRHSPEIARRVARGGGFRGAARQTGSSRFTAPYRGYDVYECPPNGQGMAALMILRTLEGYALGGDGFSEADRLHLLAEANKAAYWVRDNFIGDPDHVSCRCGGVSCRRPGPRRLAARSASIVHCRAPHWAARSSRRTRSISASSTATAMPARSSIRCFRAFGSGIVAPESGVLLHNRGTGFRTIPGHPNAIAPRKRPLHTIIPECWSRTAAR